MDLKDKTVILIGATGGIGSALAKNLNREGARLILISKSEDKLAILAKELNNSQYFTCDLTNTDEVHKTIAKISNSFSEVSVLVNAAGIGIYKNIEETADEDLNNSYRINVLSPFLFIRDLLPKLKQINDSLVLNIGSGAGTIPMRSRSVYCSTKYALRGLILSLAEEFKEKNPKFLLITLGSTITNFGGKTIAEKKQEYEKGRAYFSPEWVANKLMEIIKDNLQEVEITLFPGDYGFGTWKKP